MIKKIPILKTLVLICTGVFWFLSWCVLKFLCGLVCIYLRARPKAKGCEYYFEQHCKKNRLN
jgi:hypothetical protein